jgi:prepilin-type N-terminal cleavage/methylation domain-containing protein
MRTPRHARGFTLIEVMGAMAIMLLGATGLAGLFAIGERMNGDARRMTRATAVAQDLVNNVELWPYDEAATSPLANRTTANDADIADTAQKFEGDADPVSSNLADHGEEAITALGAAWTGIPTAQLAGEYQRVWNVAPLDTDGDGAADALSVAVVVRWPHGTGAWRSIVLHAFKPNPARN